VLHSQDDPIVPVDCVPVDECVANPNIITALTRRGGHVCYFLGADGKQRWYTHATVDFFRSAFKAMDSEK
jgi:predicted alpha/beta-fold hydrolase